MRVSDDMNIPIDETNFPDALFRMYIQKKIAKGAKSLTESRRESIEEISLTRWTCRDTSEEGGKAKKICNLKGLEYFPNLKRLVIRYTDPDVIELKSLDVQPFTKLEVLTCCGCETEELIFGKNDNLKMVQCNCNKIKKLDVSGLKNLEELEFIGNQITEIDLRENKKIKEVNGLDNPIWSIKVPENSVIEGLLLSHDTKTFFPDPRYGNPIELNIGDMPKLKRLLIRRIPIFSLDLSTNTDIEAIEIEGCNASSITFPKSEKESKVKELFLGGNSLVELNLNGLCNLSILRCDGFQGCELDLSSCKKLQTLSIGGSNIKHLNVKECKNLSNFDCQNASLESLDLSGLTHLGFLDCSYNKITTLNLSGCIHLTKGSKDIEDISPNNVRFSANPLRTIILD